VIYKPLLTDQKIRVLILAGVLVKHRCIYFFDTIMIVFVAVLLHDIRVLAYREKKDKIQKREVSGHQFEKS
jgi:hypothetical protein